MIELPPLGDLDDELWRALLDIADRMHTGWTLIGGQMVLLHALGHGRTPPRVSRDLDLVIDARVRPPAIPAVISALDALGFEPGPIGFDEVAHRFTRGQATIDILAPDGVGTRTSLRTIGRAETVPIGGGTYALNRSEPIEVVTNGRTGTVHRPDLAGALVVKSYAVRNDTRRGPGCHLGDLAFLYSLISDPDQLKEQLGPRKIPRLAMARELADPRSEHWLALADDELIANAQAARMLILGDRT